MLTTNQIQSHFVDIIDIAKTRYPLQLWLHKTPTIEVSPLKGKNGLAYSTGHIIINSAFLSTSAVGCLRKTICHEIAHLVVGIQQAHNKKWESVFDELCSLAVDLSSKRHEIEKQQVKDNIPYKYRLLGYLTDDRVLDLGGVYRRTKKYLSYDGNHSFLGVRITSYKYVDYKAPLPKEIIQDKHLKELV